MYNLTVFDLVVYLLAITGVIAIVSNSCVLLLCWWEDYKYKKRVAAIGKKAYFESKWEKTAQEKANG